MVEHPANRVRRESAHNADSGDLLALTIHRPYPYAILHLPTDIRKPVENRTWKPPMALIGKRLAIHAGKAPCSDDGLDAIEAALLASAKHQSRFVDAMEIPGIDAQGIVGTVVVRGWVEVRMRDSSVASINVGHAQLGYEQWAARQLDTMWLSGPYGWLLDDPRPLATPIACRGAQGLWRVPAEVVAQMVRQDQQESGAFV